MFELYIKYLLEGIAVAVAAYFIPRKKVEISEIIFIALSAAATFAVLDIFAPKVGDGARKGAGFGIGANTVGWPMGGAENFEMQPLRGGTEHSYEAALPAKPTEVIGDKAELECVQKIKTLKKKVEVSKDKVKKAVGEKREQLLKKIEDLEKRIKNLEDKLEKMGAAKKEHFDDSTVASTVASTVSSAVSTVTGSSDSKSADTKSTETKSADTQSTETKSVETKSTDSSDMMSMDSTGSAVTGYDQGTKQYSSF